MTEDHYTIRRFLRDARGPVMVIAFGGVLAIVILAGHALLDRFSRGEKPTTETLTVGSNHAGIVGPNLTRERKVIATFGAGSPATETSEEEESKQFDSEIAGEFDTHYFTVPRSEVPEAAACPDDKRPCIFVARNLRGRDSFGLAMPGDESIHVVKQGPLWKPIFMWRHPDSRAYWAMRKVQVVIFQLLGAKRTECAMSDEAMVALASDYWRRSDSTVVVDVPGTARADVRDPAARLREMMWENTDEQSEASGKSPKVPMLYFSDGAWVIDRGPSMPHWILDRGRDDVHRVLLDEFESHQRFEALVEEALRQKLEELSVRRVEVPVSMLASLPSMRDGYGKPAFDMVTFDRPEALR